MAEEQLRLQREAPSRIERKIEMEPEEETEEGSDDNFRGGLANKSIIMTFAIVFDLISFIPGANDITIIVADLVFIPWFYFSGIKFTPIRIALWGATSIIEAVPGPSWIPTITINAIYNLWSSSKK